MKVPRFGHAVVDQGVAPLTKALAEEIVRYPNDFPEEPPFVGMGYQVFCNYAVNHLIATQSARVNPALATEDGGLTNDSDLRNKGYELAALLKEQVERTWKLFWEGLPLASQVGVRLAVDVELFSRRQ